jgi:hypothetical protein
MYKLGSERVYFSIDVLSYTDGELTGNVEVPDAENQKDASQYLFRCWNVLDLEGAQEIIDALDSPTTLKLANIAIDDCEDAEYIGEELHRGIIYVSKYTQQPYYISQ